MNGFHYADNQTTDGYIWKFCGLVAIITILDNHI
jgi:hypothetical protein